MATKAQTPTLSITEMKKFHKEIGAAIGDYERALGIKGFHSWQPEDMQFIDDKLKAATKQVYEKATGLSGYAWKFSTDQTVGGKSEPQA